MGGCPTHRKCYALGCGTQINKNPNLKFHKFPSNRVRCRAWVIRSGNIALTLESHDTLVKNRALCSKHFHPSAYRVAGDKDSNLNPNALPSIFIGQHYLPEASLHPNFPRPDNECSPSKLPQPENNASSPKSKKNKKKKRSPKKGSQGGNENTSPSVYHFTGIVDGDGASSTSLPVSSKTCTVSPQRVLKPMSASPSGARVPSPIVDVNFSSPSLRVSSINCSLPSPKLSPPVSVPVVGEMSSVPQCDTGVKRNVSSVLGSVEVSISKRRRLEFSCSSSSSSPSPLPMSTPLSKPVPGPSRSIFPYGSSVCSPVLSPVSGSDQSTSSQNSSGIVSDVSFCSPSKSQLFQVQRKTVFSRYQLRKHDITPRKKKILDDVRLYQRQVRGLQRSVKAVKDNRKALLKTVNAPLVSRLKAKLKTKEAVVLFNSQLNKKGKHPKGFRWTLEEKTLGLTLYKGSRKNYSFLRKILHLPTRRTLVALMSLIKFDVGDNRQFFAHLKKVIEKLTPKERAVVLMWDEVQIRKSHQYNEKKDCVEGYVNHGDGIPSRVVANKCLVFMVQSLTKKWKQPVAYYFSEDETPAKVLAKLIVGVVSNLQEVGFDVRASVSDQGGNNLAAVGALRGKFQPYRTNSVPLCPDCKQRRKSVQCAKKAQAGQPGRKDKNRVTLAVRSICQDKVMGSLAAGDGQTVGSFSRAGCRVCRANALRPATIPYYRINVPINIYHVWDVPHLLKNTRNNFLTYNVEHEEGVAKWSHLLQLKKQECEDGTFYHMALKLTDDHLRFSRNSDKMKVRTAAQLLSTRVANALKMIHKWSDGKAIPGCLATAAFIQFVDHLFDSFNGSNTKNSGKKLRTNLTDDSAHFKFWEEAEVKIRSWYFINSTRIFAFHRGWLENISAIRSLWTDLKTDLEFTHLNLRRINQDPLENLFSVIKQEHKIPTVAQFISGLKTAIITNLRNSGIRGANCEDDESSLLTDLNVFFKSASKEGLEKESGDKDGSFDDDVSELDDLTCAINRASIYQPNIIPKTEPLKNVSIPNITPKTEPLDTTDPGAVNDMFDILYGDPVEGESEDVPTGVVVDISDDEDDDCEILEEKENCIPGPSGVNRPVPCPISLDNVPVIPQRKRKNQKVILTEEEAHLKALERGKKAVEKERKGLCGHRRQVTGFVCGFMVKKVLIRMEKCEECERTLVTDKPNSDHEMVIALERDDVKMRLTYASKVVIDVTIVSVEIFLVLMHTDFHKPGLRSRITEEIMEKVDLTEVGCDAHRLEVHRLLLLYFCRVSIYHRCRILNRMLAKEYQTRQTVNSYKATTTTKWQSPPNRGASTSNDQVESESVDDPQPVGQFVNRTERTQPGKAGKSKGKRQTTVPSLVAPVVVTATPEDPYADFPDADLVTVMQQMECDFALPGQPPVFGIDTVSETPQSFPEDSQEWCFDSSYHSVEYQLPYNKY